MTTTTFDTLGYFERLKAAGMPEQQAKVQVEAMQDVVKSYDETSRKELATKGDIQALRMEMVERLANTKHEILKWMIGILIGQTALIVALMAYMK